jgi:thiosulfate/3-mercaptopyruvate sulfurtransferase
MNPAAPGRTLDMLVSTEWLASHLDDPRIRIVDCRFYFDDFARGRRAYEASHVPGAVYMDWTQDISEPRNGMEWMLASADHVSRAMERLGIGDDTLVVGYDDEGGHFVSRLWLVLRRYGHDTVSILEGGWVKWLQEGRPTRGGQEPVPPARFTVTSEQPDLLVDADDVLRRTGDPTSTVLDVRRLSEFTGEEVRSKHGGHVPGATWGFWQDNLYWDTDRTFRPDEEIRRRYDAMGVTPDKRIVTYCHGAVRAAHTAFALARLGYPHVQVYDGSWEEWGSRDDLPIATGAPGKEQAAS